MVGGPPDVIRGFQARAIAVYCELCIVYCVLEKYNTKKSVCGNVT